LSWPGSEDSPVSCGRTGVLVDERYGQPVIEAVRSDGVVLAVPVERSGQEWLELESGKDWLEHVASVRPEDAKVLVRDNPAFLPGTREQQLRALRQVSNALRGLGVPLLYELLVPAAVGQLTAAGPIRRVGHCQSPGSSTRFWDRC
jgi:myo-inositol catabolism protein IolC